MFILHDLFKVIESDEKAQPWLFQHDLIKGIPQLSVQCLVEICSCGPEKEPENFVCILFKLIFICFIFILVFVIF